MWFVVVLLAGAVQAQPAPLQPVQPPAYQGPNGQGQAAYAGVRELRPLWTAKIDKAEYGQKAVLTAGNRVLLRVGGGVQARDLATGKTMWQVPGAELRATAESGVLTTEGKQLTLRRLDTGRVLWCTPLTDVYDVQVQGGTVYVTTAAGAQALSLGTGRTRWQFKQPELTRFAGTLPGIVFWNASQGEPHFPAVYALDGTSGAVLYRFGGTVGPLAAQDGQVLLKDFGVIGPDDRAELTWVDARSGQVRRKVTLQADFQCPGTSLIQRRGDEGFFAAPFFYLSDRCGTRLTQFEDDPQAKGDTPQAPLRTFAAPDDGRFRLGPVEGLLLFESWGGEARLIRATGGSPVTFNGAEMPTGAGTVLPGSGPVSRADVLGDRLYLGRTDGTLLAYDLAVRKAAYFVRLPWRGFGPTLRAGSYAVLTTVDQVAVVREAP